MRFARHFDTEWPYVLVEIKDFIELIRLTFGGDYTKLQVRISISRSVNIDNLVMEPAINFRAWLESIPRCPTPIDGFFTSHKHAYHRVVVQLEI